MGTKYFVQNGFKINSTSLHFILFFSKLHLKCPNFTGLVTERVKCKGASQCQHINEYKRANQHRLLVCD